MLYRQMLVKDLPKVATWELEWDSKLRPSGRKAPNLPLSHHTPCYVMLFCDMLCYVMLCYVMLCYVMLCYVMVCYVTSRSVPLLFAMLCYVMLCYVIHVHTCCSLSCHVRVCCCVISCYLTQCYIRHNICHLRLAHRS